VEKKALKLCSATSRQAMCQTKGSADRENLAW
jgi:hypothetical protein